jgi:trk system potassium uptake protein TrkH
VLGAALFFAAEHKFRGVFADESPTELALLSFFHSVASRTSGFTVSARFSQLEPANALLLTVLMFIGASPASMGGGITTSTFAVLMLTMWNFARGRSEIIAGRRVIPLNLLYKAGTIVTAAGLIVAVTTWLLLYTQENTSLTEALVESVSAFSTSGYSIGLTQRLNLFGQFLIAGLMFFGRIGMLTIIVALGRPRVPLVVTYPEEGILLG